MHDNSIRHANKLGADELGGDTFSTGTALQRAVQHARTMILLAPQTNRPRPLIRRASVAGFLFPDNLGLNTGNVKNTHTQFLGGKSRRQLPDVYVPPR